MSPVSKWRFSDGCYPLGGKRNAWLMWQFGFIDNCFKFKLCTKYKRIFGVTNSNFTYPSWRLSPNSLSLYLFFLSNLQTLRMEAANVHVDPSQTTDDATSKPLLKIQSSNYRVQPDVSKHQKNCRCWLFLSIIQLFPLWWLLLSRFRWHGYHWLVIQSCLTKLPKWSHYSWQEV